MNTKEYFEAQVRCQENTFSASDCSKMVEEMCLEAKMFGFEIDPMLVPFSTQVCIIGRKSKNI